MANPVEEWESATPINSEWEQATPVSKQDWDAATPISKEEKSVGGLAWNAVKDVGGMAKGLFQLLGTSPLEVASGMGKLAVGGSSALQKKMGIVPKSTQVEGEAAARTLAEPFVKAVRNPSGIPGQVLDYAYEKPVSTALMGSGGLLGAGRLAEGAGAIKTANALIKGSEIINPLTQATKIAEKTMSAVANNISPKLLKSAMKINPSMPKEEIDKIIQTMRDERIVVSEKGLTKNRLGIDKLNDEISGIIDTGKTSGQIVNMDSVTSRIDSLKDFYKDYPRAKKYLDDLDGIKKEIIEQNPENVPIDVAQRMKQRIYQIHRKHYNDMKGVEVEADKAVARGLKEEIANQNPGLDLLNKRESSMLALDEFLEKAVNKVGNYNILTLGDSIIAVGGAAVGGPAGAVKAGMFKHLIDGPAFKSKMALALDSAQRTANTLSKTNNLLYGKAIQKVSNETTLAQKQLTVLETVEQKFGSSPEYVAGHNIASQQRIAKIADLKNQIKINQSLFDEANTLIDIRPQWQINQEVESLAREKRIDALSEIAKKEKERIAGNKGDALTLPRDYTGKGDRVPDKIKGVDSGKLDIRPMWEIKNEADFLAREQNIDAIIAKNEVMQKLADNGDSIAKTYVKRNEPIVNMAQKQKELLNQIKIDKGFSSSDIIPDKEPSLLPSQNATLQGRIRPSIEESNVAGKIATPVEIAQRNMLKNRNPRIIY